MIKAFKLLEEQLSLLKDEREKLLASLEFCLEYQDFLTEECNDLAEKCYKIAKEKNFVEEEALAQICRSYYAAEKKEYARSQQLMEEGLALAHRTGSKIARSFALQYSSFSFWAKGQLDVALNMAFEALKIAEETRIPKSIAWCNYTLGVFYFDLKDLENSLKYFNKALQTVPDPNQEIYGKARCYSGIASIGIKNENYKEALEYIERSQIIYEELEHGTGISRALNDKGVIFLKLKKYSEAEQSLLESLKIRENIKYNQGITTTRMELGRLFLELEEYDKALIHLKVALEIAEKTVTKSKMYQVHELLSILYKQLKDAWKALEHTEKAFRIRSEVLGLETTNKISQIETRFAKEKLEQETELYRLRHVELKAAYDEIEQKNKDIADSITYALRIQQAILPSKSFIKKELDNFFILYKPKDIVAGDFYWMEKNEGEKIFIAAADCTGHGVPGAMVSVVCANALNRTVKEFKISEAGKILDKTRELVIETFDRSELSVKDGMDISLLVIDKNKKTVQWSGANNSLYIVSDGQLQLVPSNKQPVGVHFKQEPFITHQIELQKDSTFYLLTDGYVDQFGGAGKDKSMGEKKFMSKRLRELLLTIQHLPMQEQEIVLNENFENWKGDLDQIDDVCIIGIKLSNQHKNYEKN